MDDFTRAHLDRWLSDHVAEVERDETHARICALVDEWPEVVESHSWPEIRTLTETSRWLYGND